MKKPKILFTSPIMNHPPIGGPELRINNSIVALSQISDLYIYSQTPITKPQSLEFYEKLSDGFFNSNEICNNELFIIKKLKFISAFINKITKKKLNVGNPYQWAEILHIIKIVNPDIIWLGYGNISYPLLKFLKENTKIPIVCDTDSVWSRFILRGIPYASDDIEKKEILDQGKLKEEEEKWGTQIADITTAVSEIDAEYYQNLSESAEKIQIFSNVIDLEKYTEVPIKLDSHKNPSIFLAGTFWKKSPMEEAARWTIEQILPKIIDEIPNAHLYIVGKGSKECLSDINDPSITILGIVDSVLPYLYHSDIVIVPLKFESGTRFKILEAGACKKAVVSTTLGAEGIDVIDEINILIADEPNKFAEKILYLLRNPQMAEILGNNLYKLVQEEYNIPNLVREGEKICSLLLNDKRDKE